MNRFSRMTTKNSIATEESERTRDTRKLVVRQCQYRELQMRESKGIYKSLGFCRIRVINNISFIHFKNNHFHFQKILLTRIMQFSTIFFAVLGFG